MRHSGKMISSPLFLFSLLGLLGLCGTGFAQSPQLSSKSDATLLLFNDLNRESYTSVSGHRFNLSCFRRDGQFPRVYTSS